MVKRLLMLMATVMVAVGAMWQGKSYDLCLYKDGAVIYNTAVSGVDSIAFAETGTVSSVADEPEYVDLGLASGLLWATHNLGAEKSYEYGDYYAWGENYSTKQNKEDAWFLYGMTYEELKGLYIDERGNLLDGADPVWAYYLGADEWRMPTREDFIELLLLPHVNMELNGVKGYMFVGKNGKTLFLPSAGGYIGEGAIATHLIGEGEIAEYWTATAYAAKDGKMYFATLNEGGEGTWYWSGSSAMPVRPVKGKKQETNKLGYVDLGLPSGTLWATYNVGATKPEEYGDYYAWGEFVTKDEYTEKNSNFYGVEYSELKKNGIIDENGNLNAKNDAATVNFGKDWRMPTKEEIKELVNLPSEEAEVNGVKGRMFTGTNGNTLFLPFAGYRSEDELKYAGDGGDYWSASAFENRNAYYLSLGSNNWFSYFRYVGYTVRPVLRTK